jgi:outer membrane cobalamin receptor
VEGERPPRTASEVTRKRDVLRASPHRTASDLLLVVPGVFITQHSGQGKAHQIFLRGFDAVHGQDIEIWAGGAPVNEVSNVHGQGYADLHFLMPEVVKQIRSTPGTYDPRQGDFAVAGSLRFDLGYDEPGASASATLGSRPTPRSPPPRRRPPTASARPAPRAAAPPSPR